MGFQTQTWRQRRSPHQESSTCCSRFSAASGIDFTNTFAPVIKWTILRTAITLAATKHRNIHHMDVRIAFLRGLLKERVYMCQSLGFHARGQETRLQIKQVTLWPQV